MTTAKFQVKFDLIKSIVVYKGVATADGDLNCDSIVCSELIGAPDFLTNKSIVILSGANMFMDQIIYSFDNITGTIWTNSFPSQVLSGTTFCVLAIPTSNAFSNLLSNMSNIFSNYDDPIYNSISFLDYWSPTVPQLSVTDVAANLALPDITLPPGALPNGISIVRVTVMFKFRVVENTNGSDNALSGAQSIFIDANGINGFSIDALDFVDQLFDTPASSREGGDVIISNIDAEGLISSLDQSNTNVLNFQWTNALASQANLNFNDVQIGIRIYYNWS